MQGGHRGGLLDGLGASSLDWEVIVVEANAQFSHLLHRLKDKYLGSRRVKRFSIYNGTAIATYNGNITFIADQNGTDASAGSTTHKDSLSAVGWKITVRALDIVTLFRLHKIRKTDYVVVKMDIEGSEFDIIRRVISTGLTDYIDVLAAEYHHENYWVFRHNPVFIKQYECLQWMMEPLTKMKQVKWN
jgi:FkbM family methyltransferase